MDLSGTFSLPSRRLAAVLAPYHYQPGGLFIPLAYLPLLPPTRLLGTSSASTRSPSCVIRPGRDMLLAQAQFSSGLASPRRQVSCRPQAAHRVVASQAATTSVQTLRQESNILPAPPSEARTLGR